MLARPLPAFLANGELLSTSLRRRIFAIGSLYSVLYAMTWPLLVLLAEKLHLSGTQLGEEFALIGLGQIVAGLFAGKLCNRFGNRAMAVAGSLLLGFGWFTAAFSFSISTLSVAMFFTGVGTALYTAMSSFLGAHTPVEERTRVFAYQLAAMGAGFMAGPMVTAGLQTFGLATACMGIAVGASCLAVVAYWVLPATQRVTFTQIKKITFSDVSSNLRLMGLPFVALILMQVSDISANYFVPVHARHAFDASPAVVSALFGCIGLSKLVAPLALAVLRKITSEKTAATCAFLVLSIAVGLCGFATSVGKLLGVYLVWSLAFDVTNPYIKALISRRVNSSKQASAASAQTLCLGLVNMLMPLLAGWTYSEHGTKPLFALTGLAGLIGAGLLWEAFSPSRKRNVGVEITS